MPSHMGSSAMSGLGGAGMPSAAGAPAGGGGMPMMPMPMGGGAGAGGGMPMGRGGASPHLQQNRPAWFRGWASDNARLERSELSPTQMWPMPVAKRKTPGRAMIRANTW